MANVPYTPFPQVMPQEPVDIGASAGAFGSQTAAGVGGLGTALIEAGGSLADAEFARDTLKDELYANDANTEFMKRVTGLYSEYQKNKGRSAQEALPGFQQSLSDLYHETVSSLPNPTIQSMAGRAMSYTLGSYLNYSRSHADREFEDWRKNSFEAANTELGNQAVLAMNDPEKMDTYVAGAESQTRQFFADQGYDEAFIDTQVKDTRSGIYKSVIENAFADEPSKAQALYDKYKGELTAADNVVVDAKLRGFQQDVQAEGIATNVSQGTSADLIKQFEGFRTNAYMDVNAYRAGYGSDTYTDAQGNVHKVDQNTVVTQEDADRDLSRRIGEFASKNREEIGGVWDSFPENVKAGLNSVAYNYGSLPVSVIEAAQTGDPTAIANAVANLKDNPDRRRKEAEVILGGLVPKADAMEAALDATKDQPNMQAKVFAFLNRKYAIQDARVANFNQQYELNQKIKKDEDNKMEDALLPYVYGQKKPPNFEEQYIVNNPKLLPETKEKLMALVKSVNSGEASTARSAKTSADLLARMRLPPGDPNRINDNTPIYAARTSDPPTLNNADFNMLLGQFKDNQTEDGQKLGTTLNNLFNGVKQSITGSNPIIGHLDAEGDIEFFKYQQWVNGRVAEYRKANKNVFDLFDPTKPEFVGDPGALYPFQTSLDQAIQKMRDKYQPPAPAPTPEPPKPQAIVPAPQAAPAEVPKRLPDETPDQYDKRLSASQGPQGEYQRRLQEAGITGADMNLLMERFAKGTDARTGPLADEDFQKLSLAGKLALMNIYLDSWLAH